MFRLKKEKKVGKWELCLRQSAWSLQSGIISFNKNSKFKEGDFIEIDGGRIILGLASPKELDVKPDNNRVFRYKISASSEVRGIKNDMLTYVKLRKCLG